MPVRHLYSVICDDVRREDNGKLLVLGMYTGTIVVPQLPTVLPSFTVLIIFEGERPERWSWRLAIRTQSAERSRPVAEVQGFADIVQPGQGAMPVKFLGLRIDETGLYSAVLEIDGGREPFAIVNFNVAMPSQLPPGMSPFPSR